MDRQQFEHLRKWKSMKKIRRRMETRTGNPDPKPVPLLPTKMETKITNPDPPVPVLPPKMETRVVNPDSKPVLPSKLRLKLTIDKKREKVVFAEAGKDFVDFLFNLLSLPLATITSLLTNNSMVGSVGNLCQSIENLSDTYLQPNTTKEFLLKPQHLMASDILLARLSISDAADATANRDWIAPQVIATSEAKGGFVTGVVNYMVLDNLVVKPLSAISGLTLLNSFGITGTNDFELEERVVHIGRDEGLRLLKASLQSTTVLTSVFLQD